VGEHRRVTAGTVLREAERHDGRAGHRNLGPLSTDHGFLPPPGSNTRLPDSHAAWDEVAAALPELHRSLTLRGELDRLPILPADPESLPDTALQRAATILGLLAHAYHHLSPTRPAGPPPPVAVPWAQVCRRLDRSGPYLSYVDLIVSNWRLVDPTAADPMRVANLRLLVPTVDNEEEHVFYLTQAEILARTAPVVAATVRADDAVAADDPDALGAALATIRDALRAASRISLSTISPRPASRSYVDPVVWARTVAPLAVPIAPGALGPSGTAAPVFNLLDSVLGRAQRASHFGREIAGHRAAYPRHWRRFLAATDTIGIPAYLERAGRPALRELFREALDAYAGPDGFLARHRRKVFGYLEIAFKVGRGVTIGGFTGTPRDRTWARVDRELEESQRERLSPEPGAPRDVPHGPGARSYRLSELMLHNDADHGHWVSVDGEVYDVDTFLGRHPGGPAILTNYAGRDATEAFHRLHAHSAAASMLLRRRHIGMLAGPASSDDPRFTAWAWLASAVVEMQNTLRQDHGLDRAVGPGRLPERPPSPYLLHRRADSYRRFLLHYLRPIGDAAAESLWPATVAAHACGPSGDWMRRQVDALWVGPAAADASALHEDLIARLVSESGSGRPGGLRRVDDAIRVLEAESARLLTSIKTLLRAGILALERPSGPDGDELIALAQHIPGLLLDHLTRVTDPANRRAA
jgi:cytochrome b involved in lipid metabolism